MILQQTATIFGVKYSDYQRGDARHRVICTGFHVVDVRKIRYPLDGRELKTVYWTSR